ncbi:hypothetical protein ACFW6C_07515 [Streptomyces fungicidicus]|uniref:hypothetical protein n=1 Tax=Streptomyces fungicidicus TaxID=68203 RepID=UPI0036A8B589
MPLTDPYGQNVPYSTLTDQANAQTLGQGLVEGIVPRTNMRFKSANVRGATITKPVAGMVTWLEDVRRLEVYDGTGWSTITAGTSAWTTIQLTPPFSHNGNSQGTFQYRLINLFGELGLMFRGGLSIQYPGSGGLTDLRMNAFALPTTVRPSTLRTLVVPCSDVSSERITLKMDVTTAGLLNLYGTNGTTRPPWVGFNGVFCSL